MASSYAHVFKLYLRQAKPVDLAKTLPGKKMHLKSIANGLENIRLDISYTIHALSYYFSGDEFCYHQDAVSRKLTSSVVLLEGLLDALVICSLPDDVSPSHKMNFRSEEAFYDTTLCQLQDQIKSLQSFSDSNRLSYADLWTVADFWKHYLPCVPLPKEFPDGSHDFQVELGLGKSGPILHDLIIPAFNYTCEMVKIIGQQLGMKKDDWFVPKIDHPSFPIEKK